MEIDQQRLEEFMGTILGDLDGATSVLSPLDPLTRAIGTCRIAGQVAHRAIPHAVPHVVSPTVKSGAHISSGGRGLHAPTAGNNERPVGRLEVVDVGAKGFGNPQSVQRQQACERVIPTTAESGLDEERTEFVAIQPEGRGLVVLLWTADMCGRVAFDEAFLGAVLAEPADG